MFGGACSMYGGENMCIEDFGGESERNENTRKTQAQMGG